ncbi:MAG: cysteine synthase A [Clostridia bacterium]|nr:cysteine synthase A [Clostridia bacterium]
MSKIFNSATELIGNTPLLQLNNLKSKLGFKGNIFAKLEFLNPAGSIKDRVAQKMIDDYEKQGLINKDTVIIEPTSGNTGIGLALVSATRGYKSVIVMPNNMSVERIKIMKAYGAEVILTDGTLGMKGAIDKANELKSSYKSAIIVGQFTNPSNPKAHYETTGPEIYNDLDGEVDILVAGVGTGGTITGTGKYLKEKNKNIKVIAVEPQNSPLLSSGKSGTHGIQGIGANFIPEILDTSIYDEIITVTGEDAYKTMQLLAKTEGVLVGISSGASLHAGIQIANNPENANKNIVVILPDTGDRYLSTKAFD